MNQAWLLNVSPDKKQDVIDAVKHSTVVLRQLQYFIEHEIKQLDQTGLDDYSDPSWSHKQADRLGQLRVLRKILAILPNKTN